MVWRKFTWSKKACKADELRKWAEKKTYIRGIQDNKAKAYEANENSAPLPNFHAANYRAGIIRIPSKRITR